MVCDEETVLALEFVYRSEDITVWFGNRTLAVMAREAFARWSLRGGDLIIDDLVFSSRGRAAHLTIDGRHTYVLAEATLADLAHHTRTGR
ncbi:hypothetical protein GCM10027456_00060 [Kineosporia babensis]